jgi:predicted alpha/beta-hydrolase family hydrolase
VNVRGLVLFPGAGSSASHSALVAIEHAVGPLPVARIDFPYRKAGKSFPDKSPVLVQCVKDEVRLFAKQIGCDTSALVIGGRSMGGRMCTMANADEQDPLIVAGVVCIGFPLHPPKKPDQLRTAHLPKVTAKTLFISGTKDEFGTPAELQLAWSLLPQEPTTQFIENGRHELKGVDDVVATAIAEWLQHV